MKTIIQIIIALGLIILAIWITMTIGHSLVAKICVWVGLLVLFSIKFEFSKHTRVMLFARIGLLFNVIAMLMLTLFKSLIISRGWYERPDALGLFTNVRWVVDTVPAYLEYMVNKKNWGTDIFPEYAELYFTLADYSNLLLQVLLFAVIGLLSSLLFKPATT